MKGIRKSVLLKTSTASDVQHSDGYLAITGCLPIRVNDILDIKQIKYKAEVPQVVKVGFSGYTPQGNTPYTVDVAGINQKREGYTGVDHRYSYTTPAVITTLGATAALQREAITAKLAAQINADHAKGRNFVTALSLGTGTGFTLTDDAGYFPARIGGASSGRKGATQVAVITNSDGSGWVNTSAENLVTTTAVYSFGEGQRMLDDKPVIYAYSQNLVSGELSAPVTIDGLYADAGQHYDAFMISALKTASAHAVTGQFALEPVEYVVFVDNGTGTSTTNLTGFIAFEKAMFRELFGIYAKDPASNYDFFDNAAIAASTTTGVAPAGTDNVACVLNTANKTGVWYYNPQSTATIVAPIVSAAGLPLTLDATDEEGMEFSTANLLNSPKEFTVGKQEFSLYAKIKATHWDHMEEFSVGFRKKTNTAANQNYAATLAAYDVAGNDFAVLGNASEAVSGLQRIMTSLASGGVISTSTAITYTAVSTHDFEVRVDINGLVHFFLDGVDVTAKQATQFSFAAGAVVIPFIIAAHDANVDAAPLLVQVAALPTATWRL